MLRQYASRATTPVLLLAILTMSAALRLPFLSAPLTVDEGSYAYGAYWWARGLPLYSEVWEDRPQGIFVLYYFAIQVFGESVEALRAFGIVYDAAATLALFVAGYLLRGVALGALGAFFYCLISTHPRVEGVYPNGELFMALPTTVSACCLLMAVRSSRRQAFWLVAAGVAAGLAFTVKQSGVAALLMAVAYAGSAPVLAASGRRRLEAMAAVALGFGAVLVAALAHGLTTAPQDYLAAAFHLGWPGDHAFTLTPLHQLERFTTSFPWIVINMPFFFIAAVFGLIWRPGLSLAPLWLGTSSAGAALGGDWSSHYYLQLAPPLALLSAHATLQALSPGPYPPRTWAGAAMAVAFGIYLAFLVFQYDPALAYHRRKAPDDQVPYGSSGELARYVEERTLPGDTVYVAYDGAHVAYLSRRKSATKYLFALNLFSIPGAYESLLQTVADRTRRPVYIVVNAEHLDGPEGRGDDRLLQLVQAHYVKEAAFEGGFAAYRRVE